MSQTTKNKILSVLTSLLAESILESTLVPLYPNMVRYLLPNEPEIGYYSGLLGSSFYLPLFIMNLVWGGASDRIGRKPVLVLGLLVCLITTIGLGFANTFKAALACRFIAGLFGANSTVVKGMIGDISKDQRSRAWGYSMYGSIYGLGGIIGPALGGYLANPADNYWFVSKDGIYGKYPYLLVCMLPAVIAVVAIPITMNISEYSREQSEIVEIDELPITESTGLIQSPKKIDLRRRTSKAARIEEVAVNEGESNQVEDEFNFLAFSTVFPILLYMNMAYIHSNYMTALPIYFSSGISAGGIGLDTKSTAMLFSLIAAAKVFGQYFVFDEALKRAGSAQNTFKLAMLLCLPAHLVLQYIISYHGMFRLVLLGYVMISFGFSEALGYLSVTLMITESQSTKNLGIAHGLASTMAALVRAVSPAICGWLWSFGVSNGFPNLVFYVGTLISLAGFLSAK